MYLFRAQFRDNRTIFNTPNPRLMNVSLMKDSKLFGKGRNKPEKVHKRRKESVAAAAAAAAALHIGRHSVPIAGAGGNSGPQKTTAAAEEMREAAGELLAAEEGDLEEDVPFEVPDSPQHQHQQSRPLQHRRRSSRSGSRGWFSGERTTTGVFPSQHLSSTLDVIPDLTPTLKLDVCGYHISLVCAKHASLPLLSYLGMACHSDPPESHLASTLTGLKERGRGT